jgi:hypothetical protein
MSQQEYNYSVFVPDKSEFIDFAVKSPKVTMRAPSFPLEGLDTGGTVEMKELWKKNVTVVEFGSFT